MKLDTPDAHLRQALRHAPDAHLQAPPELSAQILAAARRAKADQAPRPASSPRRDGSWSWRWRLGTSGAFASLLLAGVIGLLWRGEPPGPAREERASAPAPAFSTAPAPLAPAEALSRPVPAVPAAGPQTRDALPASARVSPGATRQEPAGQAKLQPQTASAEAVPAAIVAAPTQAPLAKVATPLQSPAAAASFRLSGSRASADVAERAQAAAQPEPLWPWADATARGAVLTQIRQDEARPVDAAWLEGLSRLTAGRWQPDAKAQVQQDDPALEWRLGGQTLGRLWLGRQRALWCPAAASSGACQTTTVLPQAAAELKEKLPR